MQLIIRNKKKEEVAEKFQKISNRESMPYEIFIEKELLK